VSVSRRGWRGQERGGRGRRRAGPNRVRSGEDSCERVTRFAPTLYTFVNNIMNLNLQTAHTHTVVLRSSQHSTIEHLEGAAGRGPGCHRAQASPGGSVRECVGVRCRVSGRAPRVRLCPLRAPAAAHTQSLGSPKAPSPCVAPTHTLFVQPGSIRGAGCAVSESRRAHNRMPECATAERRRRGGPRLPTA
jgi:hypothetical protein